MQITKRSSQNIVIIILCISWVLASCSQQNTTDTSDSALKQESSTSALVFRNKNEPDFQLTLNERFSDYNVGINRFEAHGTGIDLFYYYFSIPTNDSDPEFGMHGGRFTAFTIAIVPKTAQSEIYTLQNNKNFRLLGENETYIFFGTVYPYCPKDYKNCSPEEFWKVLTTFQLI